MASVPKLEFGNKTHWSLGTRLLHIEADDEFVPVLNDVVLSFRAMQAGRFDLTF